ncbi:hypothetical protein SRHO_G00029280 [Serrasalmus rhombeus]
MKLKQKALRSHVGLSRGHAVVNITRSSSIHPKHGGTGSYASNPTCLSQNHSYPEPLTPTTNPPAESQLGPPKPQASLAEGFELTPPEEWTSMKNKAWTKKKEKEKKKKREEKEKERRRRRRRKRQKERGEDASWSSFLITNLRGLGLRRRSGSPHNNGKWKRGPQSHADGSRGGPEPAGTRSVRNH